MEVGKMKRSCIFLFVMSIISLLIAAWGAMGAYAARNAYSKWKELNAVYGNDIDKAFTEMTVHMQFFISAAAFAAGLILGVFGIIGAVRRRSFTVVCAVLGVLLGIYTLLGTVYHIVKDTGLAGIYGLVFIYTALYAAAAALAAGKTL